MIVFEPGSSGIAGVVQETVPLAVPLRPHETLYVTRVTPTLSCAAPFTTMLDADVVETAAAGELTAIDGATESFGEGGAGFDGVCGGVAGGVGGGCAGGCGFDPVFDAYISRMAALSPADSVSLSHWSRRSGTTTKGDYHELDLIIIEPRQQGRPRHNTVWLGVECKNTGYEKGLLKEILGIRRELSLLTDEKSTKFSSWPRPFVPADPPSCLLVYATDKDVLDYAAPGTVFGIDFVHESM